jgi:lipoyl-dependent peroxiredoxin
MGTWPTGGSLAGRTHKISAERSFMTQFEKILFTGKMRTTGGRDGISRSDDGRLEVKLSTPRTSGSGTNPEQLLMKIAAGKMKITLPAELAVDAEVDLGTISDSYGLAVRLNVSMPGVERELGRKLVGAAQQICPYARATRGNIDVTIDVVQPSPIAKPY